MANKVKLVTDIYMYRNASGIDVDELRELHASYFGETNPRKSDASNPYRGIELVRSWAEQDVASLPDRVNQFCTVLSNDYVHNSRDARVRVSLMSSESAVMSSFAPNAHSLIQAAGSKVQHLFVDWSSRPSPYSCSSIILEPGTMPNLLVGSITIPAKMNTSAINTLANITGTPKPDLKSVPSRIACLSSIMPSNLSSQILLKGTKIEFVSPDTGKLFSFLVGLGLKPAFSIVDPKIKEVQVSTSGVIDVVLK